MRSGASLAMAFASQEPSSSGEVSKLRKRSEIRPFNKVHPLSPALQLQQNTRSSLLSSGTAGAARYWLFTASVAPHGAPLAPARDP